MRTVKVPLGDRSYPIKIGNGLLPRLGGECRRLKLGERCGVVTDRTVGPLYAKAALASLRQAGFAPVELRVPAGETAKSLRTIQACYDQLAKHRLERSSFIVALGGGVVGDIAGFLAASYLRGIGFVQVPTTLLAQVDSSVGGKVGVNLKAGKNLVGAFYQPRLVLCDLDTLKTLPKRELRAGLAEVIKYGIIDDAALFRRLERTLPGLLLLDAKGTAHIVAHSCQIKAKVVAQDEREGGLRAILNYGHTIGHALEAVSRYGRVDVAVNNAGGSPFADAATASPRFSESIIRLNLLVPLYVAQQANSVMQEQEEGGVVLNIASVSASSISRPQVLLRVPQRPCSDRCEPVCRSTRGYSYCYSGSTRACLAQTCHNHIASTSPCRNNRYTRSGSPVHPHRYDRFPPT